MADNEQDAADRASTEQGADPQGVQPAPVSEADEFTSKVRQGGDFAVEQVKAAQRELSRMKAKLGSVEQVVDAVGGSDPLLGHLRRLNTLVSNPKMREAIEHFEKTGELPAGLRTNGAETTDEFEEPWDKAVKPVVSEVSTLKAELGKLRGERGVEKVRGFFQELREEWPLADEDFKSLAEAMLEQSRQWSQTEQGRAALEAMNAETFRSLALSKLTKDQIRSALRREDEMRAQRKTAAATDSPARGRTGQERVQSNSVLEAMQNACRELGIDPRGPLQ